MADASHTLTVFQLFCLSQAVHKIGYIGIAIGLPNKASEALINAAKQKSSPSKKVRKHKLK